LRNSKAAAVAEVRRPRGRWSDSPRKHGVTGKTAAKPSDV